jgi:ligand-binding sensor domain-containing protein/two-component sensor histidine kinase
MLGVFIKRLILPFIFVCVFPTRAFLQQSLNYKNLTFENLSIEHGLSQITVHSILQDSKGFLWFGTEDGLNRYDGYSFIVYRYDPSDSNSISDNFIWSMFEDSEKNLWIGTNSGGLNKYSYSSNSFTNYNNDIVGESNNIRVIFENSNNDLWVGTNNSGLYKFDKVGNSFNKTTIDGEDNFSIRAICEDQYGILWIGTNENGLYTYDETTKNTVHFNSSRGSELRISSNSVWSLKCDKDNNIWIGTYNGGLNKYDRKREKIIKFLSDGSNKTIINNNVTSILLDDSNNPWICTEGGLSIYDQKNGEFNNFKHSLSDLRSLSNNFLRFITKDKSNLIWIGTVGGGINKLNLHKKFNQFNHNPTDKNSLSHNMIRAIEEDSKGNVWIGTLGSGINRYDKQKNKIDRFNSKNINLSEDVVTSILEDRNNNLWVGTWGGGLNKIQFVNNSTDYDVKKTDRFEFNSNDHGSISSNIVQDIYEDSKGILWFGTENGLDRLNTKTNIFEHFKYDPNNDQSVSDNRIQSNCIIEDKFGYLWVGTWKGLNRIHISSDVDSEEEIQITRFYKNCGLSDNRIISIFEENNNIQSDTITIWVGTIGGGLNKLVLNTDKGKLKNYLIENYTEKDGLPSNVIYGILGDEENNLWLSTNNGISKFNPEKELFRNYDIKDGLQSNQFFWGAFHKTRDGELYFGGINGFNSFYPNKLVENKNIPPLYITKCTIETTDGYSILTLDNVEEIINRKIEMPYDSYNIKFEFTALDLTTPSKNQYKYKLENYDDKWIMSNYLNTTNYTNVSDGDYKFQVLGSNNDGLWNNTGAYFEIVIRTPFWKTWWFILLAISVISSLVAYYIITQIKNILSVERLRTKLAADLHDNIGSSLTEISILSEVITTRLKTEDADVIKNLDKISAKSRKLIDKMSDIVWLVNPQRDSLYDLILRLQDTYSDLLSDTEISFRCENLKSLEKVSLSMEHRQHLFLIFKEAINNSITHSKCAEIILNANVNGKTLTMVLEDNGSSFDLETDSHGNGLRNMKDRAKKISGKLFLTSAVGKGTVVKYIGHI